MPLQDLRLVMAGLGVPSEPNDANRLLAASPPPPLTRGIHLRWSFEPRLGFPWGGFYLFRREHFDAPSSLSVTTGGRPAGALPMDTDTVWTAGRPVVVRSEAPLELVPSVDPFYGTGFGLAGRSSLWFHLFPVQRPAHKALVRIETAEAEAIEVAACTGNESVAIAPLVRTGAVSAEALLEADAIHAIEIRPAGHATLPPGVVVEVRFWDALESIEGPAAYSSWQPLFSAPLRLPVRRPDYPCTSGASEDVDAERARAEAMVLYGKPDAVLPAPEPAGPRGKLTWAAGSPLVTGSGTAWDSSLTGAVLRATSETTAYGIARVLARDRLLLTRPYDGPNPGVELEFEVWNDTFASLHDQCALLVRGGPAGGPQSGRLAPAEIPAGGTVSVTRGSDRVTGAGVSWGPELAGLDLVLVVARQGSVTATHGSRIVAADPAALAAWTGASLVGTDLRLDGLETYRILRFDVARGAIEIHREYPGATAAGLSYEIVERGSLAIADAETSELILAAPYTGATASGRLYRFVPRTVSERSGPDVAPPAVPRQQPLDLLLLSSLHPAVAQVLGLYWIDQPPDPARRYDYLLIADFQAQFSDAGALIERLGDPSKLDGYAVFNQGLDPADYRSLGAPGRLSVFDLPAVTAPAADPARIRSSNAGLIWEPAARRAGSTFPERTALFHVWRAALGESESAPGPPAEEQLEQLTRNGPAMPAWRSNGPRPPRHPRWPGLRLHFVDRGLEEGWYSYCVHAVDLFGRHSEPGPLSSWRQWTPPPRPRPWYFDPAAGDGEVTLPGAGYAVHLRDQIGPPPPIAIEAQALDFDDPTLVRDAAFESWFASLTEDERKNTEKKNVGLRVRWTWTEDQHFQAPDTREFRIYFEPGQLNSLRGRVTRVQAGAGQSRVETTVPVPAGTRQDAYAGADLYIGGLPYRVLGNDSGTPLRATVRNFGMTHSAGAVAATTGSALVQGVGDTRWTSAMTGSHIRITHGTEVTDHVILAVKDKEQEIVLAKRYSGTSGKSLSYLIHESPPVADVASTLALSPAHGYGRVGVQFASRTVTGYDARWGAQLLGATIQIGNDATEYAVTAVRELAPDRHEIDLDRPWEGETLHDAVYQIHNPRYTDYGDPLAWSARVFVVPYGDSSFFENRERTDEATGVTVRYRAYEVFLPVAGGDRRWLPLLPSADDHIVYGAVGVSAADDKAYVPDDPRWDGTPWEKRTGNEGRVGTPAKVYRVHRQPPAPPRVPPGVKAMATPADHALRSYHTFRWFPVAGLRAHVLRTMDETLFQVDWRRRCGLAKAARTLLVGSGAFPPEYRGDDNLELRGQIADRLNALNTFLESHPGPVAPRSPEIRAQFDTVLKAYRSRLTDHDLRVLAGLPGNEEAFTQLTIDPLDRRSAPDLPGPDDPPQYKPLDDLCAFVDALEGASTNRFLYRAAFVDAANNRSALSSPSAVVHIPNVVPPRVPVVTSALATADREITLTWAASREPDPAKYRVYRADTPEDTRDERLMVEVGTVVPASGSAEETFVDRAVQGVRTYYYRVAAEDTAGNISAGCAPVAARAYDQTPPAPPVWESAGWVGQGTGIELKWHRATSPDLEVETRILKKSAAGNWYPLTGWLPDGYGHYVDWDVSPAVGAAYRLKVRSAAGNLNTQPAERSVGPYAP